MRVTPLVWREFALLAHSKWLWILTLPFFWVGNNFLTARIAHEPLLTIGAASTATTLVGFASIIVCFRSIIGERESGSIRITAGTPLSRTAVLIGKALGRGLALALPLGLAVICLTVLGWSRYGPPPLGPYLGFLFLSVALSILFSNLITAISAITSSTVRSAGLSMTTVWFLGDGSNLFISLYETLNGHALNFESPPSDPLLFLGVRLFPLEAYRVVVNTLLNLPNTHRYFADALQIAASSETGFAVSQVFGPNPPFYLTPWFAALTLLLWLVGPLGLAGLRFQNVDLTKPASTLSDRIAGYLPIHLRRLWTRLTRAPFTAFVALVSKATNSRRLDWIPVARREFTVKSQSLGTPVLFMLTVLMVFWQLNGVLPIARETLGPDVILGAFQFPIAMLGMLGTFFFGFRSIVHERESGAIRYTTGTPISRTNVALGKIIALMFSVGTPLMYGLVIGAGVGILRHGLFSLTAFFGMLAASLLYLGFNAVLVVGLSTFVSTSTRAAALGFAYLLVALIWQIIQRSIYSLFVGPSYSLYRPPPDTAYFLTRRLFPRQLFNVLSNWALGVGNSSTTYVSALRIKQAATNPSHILISPGLVVDTTYDGHPVPIVLEPWVAVVLLAGGLLGIFALTVYRFQTTDLT